MRVVLAGEDTMGRIFEKRKERMFARWSKMAKAFTKLGKEIAISVKLGGADPASNPRLRMAIVNARAVNMPKDRIEAAIKRASSKEAEDLKEIVYEGYGPHGVAILVEAATDNQTRTVANIRSTFSKYRGNLAQAGAVAHMFRHMGVFRIAKPKGVLDELELSLIDHGLEEFSIYESEVLVYVDIKDYGVMQKELERQGIDVLNAGLQRIPAVTVEVSEEQEKELEKLIEMLEEDDDVQHVYHAMG